ELAEVAARLLGAALVVDVAQFDEAGRAGREPQDRIVAHDGAAVVDAFYGAERALDQFGMDGAAELLRLALRRRLVVEGGDGDEHAAAVEHLALDGEERADLEAARRLAL